MALERQQQLAESGSRLGIARAAAFRARREAQARSLGFTGLEDFYRRRYRDQRARLGDLAAELRCAESAVRGDCAGTASDLTASGRTVRAGSRRGDV